MPHNSGGLIVVEAKLEDIDIVLRILNEATEWLQSKGIDQYPPNFYSPTQIMEEIRRGEVYLAREGSQVVGTITLQWSDSSVWGDTPPDAGYIHKLAIRPEHTAKGVGRALLEWAGNKAKAGGKTYLRLNCMFENPRIRRYYEDAGFSYRGEVTYQGLRDALYEKHL